MKKICILAANLMLLTCISNTSLAAPKSPLRILSWEGYVTTEDLSAVNLLLEKQNYAYEAVVIEPLSEGAEQMFNLIRGNKADVTFLTLFFIKMMNKQTSKLLQEINVNSPRLTNYKHLLPELTNIQMGMSSSSKKSNKALPLYIPWGGGAYGFYINRHLVNEASTPKSIKELWAPQWKNKFSLNASQQWYNIGLAFMALDKSPFYIHDLVLAGKRNDILSTMNSNSQVQLKLDQLYANAGHFWKSSPKFNKELSIVSSWGPEITHENKTGGNWQLIDFEEGHMVWLDTINFVKDLSGKKLEAAEIFANYFISKKVQNRIVNELSMVAASSEASGKEGLGSASKIFKENMFVPPYDDISYSIMKKMTDQASTKSAISW